MSNLFPEYLKPFKPTFEQYKESRKKCGIPNARSALHNAKYNLWRKDLWDKWENLGGEIVPEYEASEDWSCNDSRVRIIECPDCCISLDDLMGDTFNPKVNPEINPNTLKREEKEFIERVNRDGVYGYCAEYWDGSQWVQTDSIWGFVGTDFIGSCYDDDLIESTITALEKHLELEAKKLEMARPDMYQL